MAFSAVAFIAPNYRDFKNYWLKAYNPGTTTPKVMALDNNGTVQVEKLQLNANGFIVSAGQALVVPYIDGPYDLWLFPTSTEADANNTSNAKRVADNIEPIGSAIINDLSQAYIFDTVAAYQASAIVFPIGKAIHLNDRRADFTVIAGTGTANVMDIIASNSTGQSLSLTYNGAIESRSIGAPGALDVASAVDNGAIINHGVQLAKSENCVFILSMGVHGTSIPIVMPNNVAMEGVTNRKINTSNNYYGSIITPLANIDVITTEVVSGFSYGITLRNFSIMSEGVGAVGTGFNLGSPTLADLMFGILIENITVQGIDNGMILHGVAPPTVINNVNLVGTDAAASFGFKLVNGQVANCKTLKVENFARCYHLDTCSGIKIDYSSASHNVPGLVNSEYLLLLEDSHHVTFTDMVWENLSNNSGNLVDVVVTSTATGVRETTNTRFIRNRWNGIGKTQHRVQIGEAGGGTVSDTFFENCRFKKEFTLGPDFLLINSDNTSFINSYRHTGYDGAAEARPTLLGVDDRKRFYDRFGIQFPSNPQLPTNPNTLDAYKEDGWIPNLLINGSAAGITYTSREGFYTRIGNVITFQFNMKLSSKGAVASGSVAIDGLPFNVKGSALRRYPAIARATSLSSGVAGVTCASLQAQTTTMILRKPSAGGDAAIISPDLTDTTVIEVSGSYITSEDSN
jgi:hypothetical protein